MGTPSRRSLRPPERPPPEVGYRCAQGRRLDLVDNCFWHLGDIGALANVRFAPILLQKSVEPDDVTRPFHLGRRGLVPRPRRSPRHFYATQYTEPERVAVAQPAMRAAVDSEQWRPEQTRPERLVDHAVEADRASECASSA